MCGAGRKLEIVKFLVAECGCDPNAPGGGRVFFAGGFSDGGVTDQVGVWGADPLHRGGEPVFKMSPSRRDVGSAACGGFFVAVGGAIHSAHRAVESHAGHGLGLAIAHRITADLGGTIDASNHPDGGAVVRLTLPVAPFE